MQRATLSLLPPAPQSQHPYRKREPPGFAAEDCIPLPAGPSIAHRPVKAGGGEGMHPHGEAKSWYKSARVRRVRQERSTNTMDTSVCSSRGGAGCIRTLCQRMFVICDTRQQHHDVVLQQNKNITAVHAVVSLCSIPGELPPNLSTRNVRQTHVRPRHNAACAAEYQKR